MKPSNASRWSELGGKVRGNSRLSAIKALTVLLTTLGVVQTTRAEAGRVFRAGAATSNITPELGATLRVGSFITYPATHIHDELHARCLVLDDGSTRLAFVVCDVLAINRETSDEAKRLIERETGLPATHVITSAVHTHSAMSARGMDTMKVNGPQDPYEKFLARRMADGVKRAINNLAPARIGWARGELPGQVFNRRWYTRSTEELRNPFGAFDRVRMNPTPGSELIEPAGPTDPEVVFFAVQTAAGRPLAVLANYSLHYVGGVRSAGEVSADYFAAFADRIQQLLGADRQDPPFVGILTNGTSGDINNTDFGAPPEKYKPYEKIALVADQLAQRVYQACQTMEYRTWVEIKVAYRELELATRRPSEELMARARAVLSRPPGEAPRYSKRDAREREGFYAARTLAMASHPETTVFPLHAVRIGDLGIMAVPVEAFVEIGLELKKRSVLRPTFIMGLANGYFGYLPTPRHHELGGYETWLSTNRVEVKASEKMTEALLEMQKGLQ